EVQLLLVTRPAHGGLRLATDRQQRHVVGLRVVEARQEVRRTRSTGREADADLASELGMGDGHERTHLLMARLDELDPAVALERTDDAVDAVSRVTEDAFDAPVFQAAHKEIRRLHPTETLFP